jgi:hypothetical protein
MDSEQNSDWILAQIERDAPSWNVDLSNKVHAFTVWIYHPHRMLYCGNRESLESACELAAERETQASSSLYIVDATLSPAVVIPFERKRSR